MKRIFTLLLGALAMVAVALLSAFITMRVAIHGREAVVPALVGQDINDAIKTAEGKGLRLNLENRFYSSDVPAGRILAQDPAPGSRVRRDWPVRITESLGPQRVSIPDLTGESERAATISIRRSSLELGAVAYLAVPGDADVVLSQTPPVNAAGVDGPRVSLLVSDPAEIQPTAYVMPSLVGLSYAAANARATSAGLHLVQDGTNPVGAAVSAAPAGQAPVQPADQTPAPTPPGPAPSGSEIVVGQYPQPGRRVVPGDAVHVTLGSPVSPPGMPSL